LSDWGKAAIASPTGKSGDDNGKWIVYVRPSAAKNRRWPTSGEEWSKRGTGASLEPEFEGIEADTKTLEISSRALSLLFFLSKRHNKSKQPARGPRRHGGRLSRSKLLK
jgi:hypothetical protein